MYYPKKSLNNSNDNPQKENNKDETKIEEQNFERLFNYLEIDNSPKKFIYEGDEKINEFESHKGNFNYLIAVLLKDDSKNGSKLLEKTLDGIYSNLKELQDLGICSENSLVCIFINEIKSFSLFDNTIDIHNKKSNLNIFYYIKAHKTKYPSSNIYIFGKTRELTDKEALKCYYLGIMDQIKKDKRPIFSSVITAGVEPELSSLKKLILMSYKNLKNYGAAVGLIESNGYGLFSMIEQYERTHFNIYNMNFYAKSSTVPLSSLLSTIYIDDNIFRILKDYYSYGNKNGNQTINYHDYSLGLYLNNNNINIQFYSKECSGKLNLEELKYTDYQEIWVNRYSGYYGNFFGLLNQLKNCENDCFKKIFLFFQIIGFLIEFIYPSISSMVIYSIFYEAFDTYDYRVSTFFTMLYIFMLLASGLCSLVSKRPQEMAITNHFLYIFMEVYYFFIIICSIIAMNNIKKNTDHNEYKFNNAAISCIIVFTLIPYIIPLLLNISSISKNFFNMIIYIVLGAPSSTSNFLMAQLWNASDTPGGNEINERKSVTLIIFFLTNLFFGSLTFYNNTRRKRANCVMGFGIFYLLYNFFKVIAIIMNIFGNTTNNEAIDSSKNSNIINSIKMSFDKFDDNDNRSEQKPLKNSSQFYNNISNNLSDNVNNDYYENNN